MLLESMIKDGDELSLIVEDRSLTRAHVDEAAQIHVSSYRTGQFAIGQPHQRAHQHRSASFMIDHALLIELLVFLV